MVLWLVHCPKFYPNEWKTGILHRWVMLISLACLTLFSNVASGQSLMIFSRIGREKREREPVHRSLKLPLFLLCIHSSQKQWEVVKGGFVFVLWVSGWVGLVQIRGIKFRVQGFNGPLSSISRGHGKWTPLFVFPFATCSAWGLPGAHRHYVGDHCTSGIWAPTKLNL